MCVFFALLALLPLAAGLSCQGDSGTIVDYYYMLKIPEGGAGTPGTEGNNYAYSDPHHPSMRISSHHLSNLATGAVAETLSPLFKSGASGKYGWIFYNDEKPDGHVSSGAAHAKGVLAWDSSGNGFWLVHSCPKFPTAPPSAYTGLAEDQQKYGQSFFCMSIDDPDQVGQILQTIGPFIYATSSTYATKYPHIQSVLKKQFIHSATGKQVEIHVQGGHIVTGFAKNSNWGKDLYEDLVAPGIQKNLLVETWCHPCFNSYCPPSWDWKVQKISNVSLGDNWWTVTHDHSKWAVATDGSIICIGDINRAASQRKRGGGTYCMKNSAVGRQYVSYAKDVDMC